MQRRTTRCSPWFTHGFARLRAPALGFAALRPVSERPCERDRAGSCGREPKERIRRRP
jgi:hypothetical protein